MLLVAHLSIYIYGFMGARIAKSQGITNQVKKVANTKCDVIKLT